MRSVWRIAVTLAVVVTAGVCSFTIHARGMLPIAGPPQGSVPNTTDHVVSLPEKTLRVSAAAWNPMTNEFPWAENFEQIRKEDFHEFPRVVTIYKLPMTDDRRLGERISENEYLELWVTHPGRITARVRVDKKTYWVMSRETFTAKSVPFVNTATPRDFDREEFKWARQEFQAELDTTRYILQSSF